jgi:hypothetical protein
MLFVDYAAKCSNCSWSGYESECRLIPNPESGTIVTDAPILCLLACPECGIILEHADEPTSEREAKQETN